MAALQRGLRNCSLLPSGSASDRCPALPVPPLMARNLLGACRATTKGFHSSRRCAHDRRATVVHVSASALQQPAAVDDYLRPGPHRAVELPGISFAAGVGTSGPLNCQLQVFVPQGQQRCPVVVLSAGFLVNSNLYRSYAQQLASWGFVAVLYDLPELVDDTVLVNTLGLIVSQCTTDSRISPYADAGAVLLAGHSRGGKLSVLAAASDPRVRGVALFDPVDNTAMTPSGPGYPSALPAMRTVTSAPRRLPVLVVGAAMNTDVIPADGNYRRFVSACSGPFWLLDLQGAGHLQFLDMQLGIFSMFSKAGSVSDEVVRQASQAALLAWATELALPLARGAPVDGARVAQRLQQVAALVQPRAACTSTVKGLDHLGGPSSETSSGGASSASANASSRGTSTSSGTGSATGPSSSSSTSGKTPYQKARGPAVTLSFQELMALRAKELKAMLVERGVDCADCFEKEDLARRIVERCSA